MKNALPQWPHYARHTDGCQDDFLRRSLSFFPRPLFVKGG